jgi:hypothetical protein
VKEEALSVLGLVKKLLFLGHFMQKTRTDNVFLNDKNRIVYEVSGYLRL